MPSSVVSQSGKGSSYCCYSMIACGEPLRRFSMAPRISITLPFFMTFLGSLLRNYYLDGGRKSLLPRASKLTMFYEPSTDDWV